MIAGVPSRQRGHSCAKSSLQQIAVSVADQLDQPLVRWGSAPKTASDGLTSQMASLYMRKQITSTGFLWNFGVLANFQTNSDVPGYTCLVFPL